MKLIEELIENRHPVIAAPLAGYIDPAQASILAGLGTRHLIYPFISSEGLIRRNQYSRQIASKLKQWRQILPNGSYHYQIFGSNPSTMSDAALFLENEENADCIDLNMGCSVKKIWKSESGSMLLQDLSKAIEIIESVLNAVKIPVTLKTRTGWDRNDENGMILIREAAKMGVRAVTLHPRFGKEQWKRDADWSKIAEAVESVDIPVIGNGDIHAPVDADRMIETTGCAGVMIGRASIGNPWIFKSVEKYLETKEIPEEPTLLERIDICLCHIDELVKLRGEETGLKESRKHVVRYLKGLPESSALRHQIVLIDDHRLVREILFKYRERVKNILVENADGKTG